MLMSGKWAMARGRWPKGSSLRCRRLGCLLQRAFTTLVSIGAATVVLAGAGTAPGSPEPQRHFRLENPANLTDAEAEAVYQQIVDQMSAVYRLSGIGTAGSYRRWQRYNTAPYLSVTHGNRYVNNYANTLARAYGRTADGESMPFGSIIVKDSFTVTEEGDVFTGSLAIMEKMQPGFDPAARDWRYTMIMPDGSLFGTTKGEGGANVAFCTACHRQAGDVRDHLFFVPEAYRVPASNAPPGGQ